MLNLKLAWIGLLVVATVATAAKAQTLAEFYSGRDVTIYVPAGPSGGYAIYTQLLARHLRKHIPGNPTIVVKYMPGGGGNLGANYIYNVAPKDGSVISAMFSTLTIAKALKPTGTQFDATKFSWLGSIAGMGEALSIYYKNEARVRTVADAQRNEVSIGATGKTNDAYMYPKLMNELLHTKFKIILGYPDTGSIVLAIERGEVAGTMMGNGVWQSHRPEWIKDHKIVMIAQTGMKRDEIIPPDVPTLYELAQRPADKAIMAFVATPAELGRAYAAPPGIPEDRLAALRKAFDETMADPEFIKDVTSRGLGFAPKRGTTIADLIKSSSSIPPPVIARTKQLLGY